MTADFCVTNLGTSCIFFIRQLTSHIQCNLADFDSVYLILCRNVEILNGRDHFVELFRRWSSPMFRSKASTRQHSVTGQNTVVFIIEVWGISNLVEHGRVSTRPSEALWIREVKKWRMKRDGETWNLWQNPEPYRLTYLPLPSVIGPGSSVGIATGYGLEVRRSNPRGGEIFRTCPDRPWGPPSLLYNGYRVFLGVKSGRGVRLTPHSLLVPWSWKGRAIPLLPL